MAEDRMLNDEILLGLIKANGGGGGGTNNYENLNNLPKINSVELKGNKSLSDLGIASAQSVSNITNGESINNFAGVENALSNKQNKLTAGNYIAIENDGTIKVTQGIGVYDVYSYKIEGRVSGNQYYTNVIKYKNGVQQSSNTYYNNQATTPINIDDRFTLKYVMGSELKWHVTLLVDSNEHQAGEDITWKYNVTKDFTETFNVSQDSSTDLATKGDITTALSPILDGQSIDSFSDVETALDGVETVLATKQNATDNNLGTDAKTIVGAINEHEGDVESLKSGLTDLDNKVNGDATVYPYADVITINDAVPANLADCSVKIEPVQDLHGYDKPWVGGAGKNKLPLVLAYIKAANTSGIWNDNVYTINSGTITVNTDDGGNVTSIKVNGTFSADAYFIVGIISLDSSAYILNGCPSGGGWGTYLQYIGGVGGSDYRDLGDSVSFNGDSDSHKVYIRVVANTVSNIEFLPMIRLATETDDTFAPYTNICPISGHTEAVVQRDGKNIIDNSSSAWEVGTINANGITVTSNDQKRTKNFFDIIKNDYICISGIPIPSDTSEVRLFFYDENEVFIEYKNYSSAVGSIPENARYFKMRMPLDTDISQLQIEYCETATYTATPYEPYAGKTYTIQLGDTIYGGTVDFDSGVMTVDRAIVDLGTLTYSRVGTDTEEKLRFKADLTNAKPVSDSSKKPNALCSEYDVVTPNDTFACIDGVTIGTTGDFRAYVDAYNNSSASDFKAAMNGVQLVYELATPFTVQLTPQQIQLLQGQNTLTASTGQISVTVNGVSGAIGSVQEQVNDHEEQIDSVKTRLIASSESTGTTQSKLNGLYMVWQGLSDNEKRRAYIFAGENTKYNLAIKQYRIFNSTAYSASDSALISRTVELKSNTSTLVVVEIKDTGTTITDKSLEETATIWYLYA